MKERRRSLRQAEILLQLEERPATTISELAERMDALRPSVSRSLRALKDQGLVYRNHNGWHLTEAGVAEAATAKAMLVDMADKVQSIAERTGEVLNRTFSSLARTSEIAGAMDEVIKPFLQAQEQRNSLLSNMAAFSELSDVISKAAGLSGVTESLASAIKSLGVTMLPETLGLAFEAARLLDVGGTFDVALEPLLEAQGLNSALLGNLTASMQLVGIGEIARQNNLFLASAIDNAFTIQQAEIVQLAAQVGSSIDFSWVSSQLTSVNRSFGQLFQHQLEQIDLAHMSIPSPVLVERITVPTATVAYYTDSLRALVDAEIEQDISPLPDQGFEELGDQSLDALLGEMAPDFVEMRRGSWSALHMSGPDRLRHAATSQRELLSQLLQHLVPNTELPADQRQGPQVKARVRIAIGGSKSDAEFADAIAEAVFSYYNQLNKYTHQNMKHEESLRAALHAGEGLIRFILSTASR